LRQRYEDHHHARILDESLTAAAELSARYLNDRYLPDKAIDVMDEAGARARISAMTRPPDIKEKEAQIEEIRKSKEAAIKAQKFEEAAAFRDQERIATEEMTKVMDAWRKSRDEAVVTVTAEDIMTIISKWTGIPLYKMEEQDMARLLKMEQEIERTVIGQHEAVVSISKALRRSRADLRDPKRPIGSFVFLGPTGVGKTLLAKALAEFMFNDADALIQIDMSEYMEKFAVSRLVGSPPGYVGYDEGGQLTEKVRRRPYSVVLFDEIEKAHPDVMHILLQILEEGKLTDSLGRAVDFRNTIIIMTSNIGADIVRKGSSLGFAEATDSADYDRMKKLMLEESKRSFKPELLNRIEDIIVFHPMTRETVTTILDLEVGKVKSRLAAKNIELHINSKAREFLISKGFDPSYGARPMRRAVERYLEDPLAEEILRGNIHKDEAIEVGSDGEKLVFGQFAGAS